MNFKHPKKPFVWIKKDDWNKLDLKEKDFVIFTMVKRLSKEVIARKLYIYTNSGYWRLQKRVNKTIGIDTGNSKHLKCG